MSRLDLARKTAYWTTPSLFALVLYWPSLMCWFQSDDFAYLKLLRMARESQGFRWALFTPLAEGTLRFLSDRAFFMSFSALFGLHALAYHSCVFLTFAASLIVLSALCSRLTGSRAAGFWAPILWTANGAMGTALSWTIAYNEILCAFVFLTGLYLLVRYAETGERRFYVAQWATFLLGFGVLELNVVYPALAAAYALCCARRILGKIWPMFLASAIYAWVHISAAPLPAEGVYKLHWDARIFSTLWTYWKWALGPNRLILLKIYPSPYRSLLAVLLMVGLLGFLAWKMWRREWLATFFAAWFPIVLAPLLPLRNHIDPLYLTVPLAGLSMWGGWAVACGWRAGRSGKSAVALLLGIYLLVSIPVAHAVSLSFYDSTQTVRRFVLSVVAETRGQKDKLVLLRNVDSEIFWNAVYGRPFALYGIEEVYLLEDRGNGVKRELPPALRPQFFATAAMLEEALRQRRAIVLDVSHGHVRDVTLSYASPR